MADELTKELESLRAHNAELLADLKKAKAKAKELGEQLEAVTAERDQAHAAVQATKLDQPVAELLARVSLAPEAFGTMFRQDGYTFALDGDQVVIRDKYGNVPTLKDDKGKPRPAQFTADDVAALAEASPRRSEYMHVLKAHSQASGGGATGSRGGLPAPQQKAAEPKPAPVSFGLR